MFLVSNILLSFAYPALLFILCLICVAGIKTVIYSVKKIVDKLKPPPLAPAKKKPTKRKPSAIRSIEINPDEVDRIYVKKIS